MHELADAQGRTDGMAAALGHTLQEIGFGVVLIDDGGRIRYANPSGHMELRAQARLMDQDGCLVAPQGDQQRRLAAALADARRGRRSLVELGPAGRTRMFGFVPIARPDRAAGDASVLVMCGREEPFESALMVLYAKAIGLTASERDVLACLCRGFMAQDIAEQRSVKLSTVRTQIGSIRDKIGARTVVELVAKVSSLPPLGSTVAGFNAREVSQ